MITGINELKTLTKHISHECKCKFNGRKCNSNQKWNNDKCWCECKKHHLSEKYYIWNSATCMITCDEIIDTEVKPYDEEAKTGTTNFNEKNATCKTRNFFILLTFY